MEKVILDAAILARLGHLDSHLELCDEEGRTVGYYVPATDPDMYRWAEAQVSVEELDRRRREPVGRTTAEVLERLRRS